AAGPERRGVPAASAPRRAGLLRSGLRRGEAGATARRDHGCAVSRLQPAAPFGRHSDAARRSDAGRHRNRPAAPIARDHGALRQGRRRDARRGRAGMARGGPPRRRGPGDTDPCPALAGGRGMLSHDLDRYIVLQRACGLKFTTQPSLLRSFVACAEAAGDTYVRADRVLAWAARTTSATQARNRLAIVRRFAMALAIEDPGHEVPSADAFGRWRFERRMPHIYTAEEIAALMAAARRLGRPGSI